MSQYAAHLLVTWCTYSLVAVAVGMSATRLRMVPLHHVSIFAAGGYLVILSMRVGLGFGVGLVGAAAGGAIFGILTLPLALRSSTEVFLFGSLAIQVAAYAVFVSAVSITGGAFGVAFGGTPSILGLRLETPGDFLIVGGVMLLALFVSLNSRQGRALVRDAYAVGTDPDLFKALGQSAWIPQLIVLCGSGSVVAVAGGFHAAYLASWDPSMAGLSLAIVMLCAGMFGGIGKLSLTLAGSAIVVILPELLRLLSFAGPASARLQNIAFGFLLIAFALRGTALSEEAATGV